MVLLALQNNLMTQYEDQEGFDVSAAPKKNTKRTRTDSVATVHGQASFNQGTQADIGNQRRLAVETVYGWVGLHGGRLTRHDFQTKEEALGIDVSVRPSPTASLE